MLSSQRLGDFKARYGLLRPQQQKLLSVVKEIAAGKSVKDIFLFWAPGGGKSLAPVILSDLLTNNRKQVWVVPRDSLKYQGESDYQNEYYPTDKICRVAGNAGDPFRGCDSCVTTYQAIGAAPNKWIEVFRKYDCMLILDEFHHLSGHGEWIKPITEMAELSFLRVFMTGTISRGDDTKLPFVPYSENGEVDFFDSHDRNWIIYSREQALSDKSIIPFETQLVDGSGTYIDLDGITRRFDTFGDKGDHLKCAFKTDYAYHMIDMTVSHYLDHKAKHGFSKLLIVSPDIKTAQSYEEYISGKYHLSSGIATSLDSTECKDNIRRFKMNNGSFNHLDCLVTVAVAYEGLSVKLITHMCLLTLIRSAPWLEQCTARVVRPYPNKDMSYIFAPSDTKLVKALELIDGGVIKPATAEPPDKKGNYTPDEETGPARTIHALYSKANIDIPQPDLPPITYHHETQSEIEHRLRKQINSMINAIVMKEDAGNRKTKQRILFLRIRQTVNNGRDDNGRLIKKSFDEMSIKELNRVKDLVKMF